MNQLNSHQIWSGCCKAIWLMVKPYSAAITTNDFPVEPPGRLGPQELLTLNSSHEDTWHHQFGPLPLAEYLGGCLHGPSDYYGPPRAERHQLWLDQNRGGPQIFLLPWEDWKLVLNPLKGN